MTQRVIRRGRVFLEIQWTEEQKTQEKARRQAFYERFWEVYFELTLRVFGNSIHAITVFDFP